MRALVPILLVLAAPTVAAQGLLVDLGDGAAAIAPLSATQTIPYAVIVDCEHAGNATLAVSVSMADVPAWASATPSPASHAVGPDCDGVANLTGVVVVTVTAEAPAFRKTQIRLVAQAAAAEGALFGSDGGVIEAGFFGILEVLAEEPAKTAVPGSIVAFPVRIRNLGNGPIRVAVEAREVGEGVTFVEPPPLVILSNATGGGSNEQVVPLHAQLAKGSLVTNRDDVIDVVLRSYYWADPAVKGDESQLSLIVHTRGSSVPGAGVALVALAGIVVALASRRR